MSRLKGKPILKFVDKFRVVSLIQYWHGHFGSSFYVLFIERPLVKPQQHHSYMNVLVNKVKIKSLFWVHIQAQSSALQTLTSTFPGHWAFTLHIHLDIHLNSLGSIRPLTRNLAPRLTNLPSQVPTLLLGREMQCSVKCLAQGHNEQMHRQGIELGTWPKS